MIRTQTHVLLALLACGLAAPLAAAQSPELARLLAPCLGADTVMVAKIDGTRIDVEVLARMAIETAASSMNSDQLETLSAAVQRQSRAWQQHIARFKKAGGESLYVVCNPSDMLLAVPVTPRLDESAMKAWFDSLDLWRMASTRKGRLLIEVFLIPSADSRRVLEAMLPSMLGPGLALDAGTLTQGLQWATISIDLPPTPSLQVHVASADTVSASALEGFVVKLLARVGEIPTLKQVYPNMKASAALLTPQVDGKTLRLSLDEGKSKRLAGDLVTPALLELCASIPRRLCATVLTGMGKALLIYANDYEDKWPPDLATLVDKAEYPPSDLICPAMRHRPEYESYVYRGADTGGTSVEPSIIMVHDRAGNHKGGRHVLFVDSHVEWVTEERFQELIEQDNRLRRGRGLPEKPAQ
jgi:prepilin-type processing-associated H-X9-DG protein